MYRQTFSLLIPPKRFIFGQLFTDLLDSTQHHGHVSKMCNARRRCRSFSWKTGYGHTAHLSYCGWRSAPIVCLPMRPALSHMADCTSNAKLHNITKHCAAPTASISNPCFVFLFLIFTKLYTARWRQADFDGMKPKMDSLWSGFGLSRVQNQRTTGWRRLPAVSSGSGECWCCAAHR